MQALRKPRKHHKHQNNTKTLKTIRNPYTHIIHIKTTIKQAVAQIEEATSNT